MFLELLDFVFDKLASTGAPIWPANPSPIRTDAPCGHGHGFMHIRGRFFLIFFYLDQYGPMWSETGPESVRFGLERSETGPESVRYGLKFLLKEKKKHKILYQNTPFCQQSIKEKP